MYVLTFMVEGKILNIIKLTRTSAAMTCVHKTVQTVFLFSYIIVYKHFIE